MGDESNDKYQLIMRGMCELRDKIDKSVFVSYEPADTPSVANPSEDYRWMLSPVVVLCKMLATFKIKVSRFDAAVRRKNKSVGKEVNLYMV